MRLASTHHPLCTLAAPPGNLPASPCCFHPPLLPQVARGDLGAELPVEEVPYWQTQIVQGCRRRAKPCIVATHMLESMITCPTPTR